MAEYFKRDYVGELIQCSKCGRVVGADQVNSSKRCEICSPPHEDKPAAKADADKSMSTAKGEDDK